MAQKLLHKSDIQSIVNWVIGMILCPLGVAFSIKGNFGVSMIEAPVYVVYQQLAKYFDWVSVGMCEYVLQGLLLMALCIAIRRFRWKYLLSFLTAMIYGFILDGWMLLMDPMPNDLLFQRILYTIIGMLLTSLAVAFFFRTKMPQEVWELFVKELSERYHLNMTKVKWIYDFSSLGIGIILMFVFFHTFKWDTIGIGSIVTTILNAPLIGMFGRLIDSIYKNKTNNKTEPKNSEA